MLLNVSIFFSCNILQNFFFSVLHEARISRQASSPFDGCREKSCASGTGKVACVAGGFLVRFSREAPARGVKREHARGQLFGGFFFVLGSAFARLTLRTAFNTNPDEPQIKNTSKTASYAAYTKGYARARSFHARLCVLSQG